MCEGRRRTCRVPLAAALFCLAAAASPASSSSSFPPPASPTHTTYPQEGLESRVNGVNLERRKSQDAFDFQVEEVEHANRLATNSAFDKKKDLAHASVAENRGKEQQRIAKGSSAGAAGGSGGGAPRHRLHEDSGGGHMKKTLHDDVATLSSFFEADLGRRGLVGEDDLARIVPGHGSAVGSGGTGDSLRDQRHAAARVLARRIAAQLAAGGSDEESDEEDHDHQESAASLVEVQDGDERQGRRRRRRVRDEPYTKSDTPTMGDVAPGTEGYDPQSALAEPNTKCFHMLNEYRWKCNFGSPKGTYNTL